MPFKFGCLEPESALGAEGRNLRLLGPTTIGINIHHRLSNRCGIDNFTRAQAALKGSSVPEMILRFLDKNKMRSALVVANEFDREALTSMALFALEDEGLRARIDKSLIAWIGMVDRLGFEEACIARPEIAGRYTDMNIIQALEAITHNPRWPTPRAKIREIMSILIKETSKGDIRSFALLNQQTSV